MLFYVLNNYPLILEKSNDFFSSSLVKEKEEEEKKKFYQGKINCNPRTGFGSPLRAPRKRRSGDAKVEKARENDG